ncbi:MAG: hypothetical protein HC769_26290 [Cyanobacteria bacterium CRU_2_1]|nr:hypothetical protein [Cyanobacteria bacterium RU_5_0]NJR62030.1 hypothetical protein [Cyanobacteria bacterium CRU_2_1]
MRSKLIHDYLNVDEDIVLTQMAVAIPD